MKMNKTAAGKIAALAVIAVSMAAFVGAAGFLDERGGPVSAVPQRLPAASPERGAAERPDAAAAGGAKVYFTSDISGRGMLDVYQALGVPASGKVAIKLHMGEPGNQNYLNPELLRNLVARVKGSFVDSNTRYGGRRGSTASHMEAAKEHGFTYAPVDILDADGAVTLPVRNGKHLTGAILGSHIMNYDWIISVAHFKGHSMAGYGGTFKNLAVGIATPEGKGVIHGGRWSGADNGFFERIVEYNKALMDARPGKMLYINVLNNLSVDCDCAANAAEPSMPDIGILASRDPVALEKASLDLIYARPPEERRHLVERIESRNGAYQVTYAEQIGLGRQAYELVRL